VSRRSPARARRGGRREAAVPSVRREDAAGRPLPVEPALATAAIEAARRLLAGARDHG